MTGEIDKIFSKIKRRMIEAIMLHDQLYQIFLFLRLYSFADEQKRRYKEESDARLKFEKFCIRDRNLLIENTEISINDAIPIEWYKIKRQDITPEDIMKATRYAISLWIDWEVHTKDLYSDAYKDCVDVHRIVEAEYLSKLIKDTDEEILEAEDKRLWLEAINYDVTEIMDKGR